MYLKVVNGTKSKEYTLTSQYNEKPYMIVSGTNKLPLTTKPPIDYTSSSESGSFYTTAENADNLRETTALTRESTYETVYLTRASTYNTLYGTQQVGYSTASSGNWDSGSGHQRYSYISYINITRTSPDSPGWAYIYGSPIYATKTYWDAYESRLTEYTFASLIISSGNLRFKATGTITTGTTYLTQASTSSTLYLTQSSTSAYGGVSSTSSSTSYNTNPGSNAYIKIINGTKTLRPLEYRSSSESASMYTTVDAEDWYLLSDTTALTRESTSQTIYNTRASTYNTIYGTRQDVTQWSASRTDTAAGWGSYVKNITRYDSPQTWRIYGNPLYMTQYGAAFTQYTSTNFYCQGLVPTGYKTVTTGATYQTRASTSETVYLTCESTSAYSGLSTSSQSAMSWV